jgi:hypothetical protein
MRTAILVVASQWPPILAATAHAQEAICGKPPSFDVVKEEAFKGELGAKAEGIAKLLGKASIGG